MRQRGLARDEDDAAGWTAVGDVPRLRQPATCTLAEKMRWIEHVNECPWIRRVEPPGRQRNAKRAS